MATTTTEAVGAARAGEHAEKIIDPIHQFEIHKYHRSRPFSLTNSGLWAIIAVACVAALFLLAPREPHSDAAAIGRREHLRIRRQHDAGSAA